MHFKTKTIFFFQSYVNIRRNFRFDSFCYCIIGLTHKLFSFRTSQMQFNWFVIEKNIKLSNSERKDDY